MTRHLIALAVALSLSACGTLTPPTLAPEPAADAAHPVVPAAWPTGAAYGPAAASAPAGSAATVVAAAPVAADVPWTTFVLDARLRQVIEQALAGNRSLRKTLQDVAVARAQYGEQDAARLPTVGGSVGTTQARTAAGKDASGHMTTTRSRSASAGVSVSAWEVDLFGRVGSLSDAALETWLASAEGARSTRIALIAETATAWLQLGADRDQLALAQRTLASAERSVSVTRKRLAVGVASRVDVRDAETVLHQARADVASYTTAVAQDRNALELLAGGRIADTLLPEGLPADDAGVAEVQAGLSSEVLLRRPDVLQAEHTLAASRHSVSAARADHFPKLTLTGSAGLASTALTSLLSGGATVWSIAPSLGVTLFDGGARASALEAARATRDGAVASYEQTLQTAFRETADALARRGTMADELDADRARVEAAQDSATLSMRRYETGVDTFLAALTSQRTLYAAQQTLVSARLTALGNRITLYKVLGGGVADVPAATATAAAAR